jgi:hypothetical protein
MEPETKKAVEACLPQYDTEEGWLSEQHHPDLGTRAVLH